MRTIRLNFGSDMDTVGENDVTDLLNRTLAALEPGDVLIVNGWGLVDGAVYWPDNASVTGANSVESAP